MNSEELRSSSDKVGQLYPVLVDYYGRVIDGEHRLSADKHWRKEKLAHIRNEKDLLIARIACNTIRRTTTDSEVRDLLSKLAEIIMNEGIEIGKVTYELAYSTGMSYRWVTKYLPDRFKDVVQSEKRRNSVAHHASNQFPLPNPPKGLLKLNFYQNAEFANFSMDQSLFARIKKKAEELDTDPTTLLYYAILLVLRLNAHDVTVTENTGNQLKINDQDQSRALTNENMLTSTPSQE